MERAPLVILALCLNALAMGPWAMQGPFLALLRYPGQAIRGIEQRLNRLQRTQNVRQQRGILLLLAVLLVGLAAGMIIYRIHWKPLDIVLLALLLPVRPTWDVASTIARALRSGDMTRARLALEGTVWRHHALLDNHALARAAIEILAVHFSEKILAPALWYLWLGMPGFMLCKALYLLQENLCQPLKPASAFSRPACLLHAAINAIPSRIAALLWLSVVMVLPSSRSLGAIRHVIRDMARPYAPEQMAVLPSAWVLGLSLGGPTSVYTQGRWEGSGTAKASASDIHRAQVAWVVLMGLLFVFLGLVA